MTWTDRYRERMNAENLARQADPVRKKAKEILEELKSLEQYVYWVLDPEEDHAADYWSQSLIEHAHALVDLGHEYKAALAANPPPKKSEDNGEDDLQSTR